MTKMKEHQIYAERVANNLTLEFAKNLNKQDFKIYEVVEIFETLTSFLFAETLNAIIEPTKDFTITNKEERLKEFTEKVANKLAKQVLKQGKLLYEQCGALSAEDIIDKLSKKSGKNEH